MMTDEELEAYFERTQTGAVAAELVRKSRKSDPLRTVQGKRGNRYGRAASSKMDGPVQIEGRTTEGAAVESYDNDDDVIEFWAQAVSVRLSHGRHVFDMLVLRRAGPGLENWKTSDEVEKSVAKGETRFVLGPDGSYTWPELDERAAALGLPHRLRLDSEIGQRALENLRHIGPYLRGAYERNPCFADAVHAHLLANPGHTVAQTLATDDFRGRADDLNFLIATGEVYTNIASANLGDGSAPLYPSRAVAEAIRDRLEPHPAPALVRMDPGTRLELDGRTVEVVQCGSSSVILNGEHGAVFELPLQKVEEYVSSGLMRGVERLSRQLSSDIARATPVALAAAQSAAEAIWRAEQKLEAQVSPRTLRRYKKKVKDGLLAGRPRGQLLLPKPRSGRGPQLPEEVERVMLEEIEREYETVASPSKKDIFDRITARLGKDAAPGRTTVYDRIANRKSYKQLLARGGKRVAYNSKPQFEYLEQGTPVHGERPFEIGHIDHTQLDAEIVDAETGHNLGRPWLTLMIDAYTRRILAFWVTFDPPSRVAVLTVLRICAQRFGRLSEAIVVDGGREFGSRDVETLCTTYETTILRREGDPRSGSLIERAFGTTNTGLLDYLAGATKIMKNVRQVTKSNNPARLAIWDLLNMCRALAWFFYEVYDKRPHPSHRLSPRDAYVGRLDLTGDRAHRFVRPDADFIILTLPSTSKGTARVDAGRGVRVNNERYRCAAFGLPGIAKDVRVRWDPLDARHIYAFVKGEWRECFARRLSRFAAFSVDELTAATAAEKAAPRAFERAREASDAERGTFLLDVRRTEAGMQMKRRGDANRAAASFLPMPFVGHDADQEHEARSFAAAVASEAAAVSVFEAAPTIATAAVDSPVPSQPSKLPPTLPKLMALPPDAGRLRAAALDRPIADLEEF
jgi:putative transposase